jgi:asparagine synthase (glutamine-hydrolysing)
MCGIAGFLLSGGAAQSSIVSAMCDRIRHRGPDDTGTYTDGPCGIGMRRLSIIDLNTGRQPLANEDGSVWVVFNGEIYNFRELRERLAAQGHRFRTNSDTETLVHLYEQDGVDGLPALRGMFAFSIWDAPRRKILLVRDRLGKKPLYYAVTPAGLFFASELKCLRLPEVPFEIDEEALRLYFLLGYVPDPYTPYRAVRKLLPGCWLRYGAGGRLETGRYWRLPAFAGEDSGGRDRPETAARVREAFDEAVRIRMEADVPLGAFLSGGIDSSLVVASMAMQSPEPVRTFSIGFEEAAFNELSYARMVAERYRTEHHELIVRPDSVGLVTKLVGHFDEPFADSSAIPTYIISEFAAQHVKVVLSGDGGDELFGGYESFFEIEKYQVADKIPIPVRSLVSAAAEILPYSAYGKNYLRMIGRPSALARYFDSHFGYYLRRGMLQPGWMLEGDPGWLLETLPYCRLPAGDGAMEQAMYFEATAQLAGDMLVKVDRASMAASLEVRCPMLDHVLAGLAASIPWRWKLHNGSGKKILLEALGDRLPPAVLRRPKMGFGVPLARWFRTSLRDFICDHLQSRRFLERGIVRPEFVKYLLKEHLNGRRDNRHRLYALLVLELWFRQEEQARTARAGPERESKPAAVAAPPERG